MTAEDPSWTAFCDGLGRTVPGADGQAERLRSLCDELEAGAQPGLAVPRVAFLRHLGDAIRTEPDPMAALARRHLADLYLAFACASGHRPSIEEFHRRHIATLGPLLARFRESPAFTDEVAQLSAERLLVAIPPERPRIASYGGQGPLHAWVAVTATRVALTLLRQRTPEEASTSVDAETSALLAVPAAAELEVLKQRYRPALQRALGEAIRSLPTRDRLILRLSLVEGMSMQAIGRSYGVDASTVCRWLAGAREALLERLHGHFSQHGPLAASELVSVVRLVRSQVELSVSGWREPS